jgi:hypothetical protein
VEPAKATMQNRQNTAAINGKRELCMTPEKWFASGESNVFRLSRKNVNGLQYIMITNGCPLGGKDF